MMDTAFRGVARLIAIGDDVGFELPKAIIDRYQLHEGDEIGLSWKDGDLLLTFKPTDTTTDSAPQATSP
jgi:antitoxin component of MazEF toxin-antitoxin module